MKIIYKTGNLLDAQTDVIAHQVNCQGVMGSGIAKQIKEKWPNVYDEYIEAYHTIDRKAILGSCQLVRIGNNKYVCNLFGQLYYGISTTRYTSYDGLYIALETLVKQMSGYKLTSVAIPYKMSSDRGGADWDIVLAMIKSVFKDTNVTIEIWSLNGYIQDVISCYDRKIEQLEKENAKLKKENVKLKNRNSDSGWQYEFDHASDWKTPVEMGQL